MLASSEPWQEMEESGWKAAKFLAADRDACRPRPYHGGLKVPIEGISHITLMVQDLERTAKLLTDVLGAEEVYSSGDETFSIAREKFFLIGGVWVAVMEGPALSERTYNHIAFKIPEEELELYKKRLEQAGVEMREGRSRIEGEGQSLYFYDYDNHLFELHTGTLERRLEAYGQRRR